MTNQTQTTTDENRPDPTTDALDALCRQLTIDQIRFVVARQEHSTDKAAAEFLDISPATVKDWKYKGAPIDEAVKLMGVDGVVVARNVRRRNLAKAMLVKVGGLDSDDERTRQGVATEIIEWEMGRAQQAVKHEGTGKDGAIEVSVTSPRNEIARRLSGIAARENENSDPG